MDRIWELLAKKFSQEISDHELRELDNLLRLHQQEFQQSEILRSAYDLKVVSTEDKTAFERSEQRLRRMLAEQTADEVMEEETAVPVEWRLKTHIQRYSRRYMAAGVNLVFITGIFLLPKFNREDSLDNKINTERGAKTTVHLPDGSVVKLNSGSRLSYNKDFGIKNRHITLEGEAYFDVTKNASMPMIVSTSSVEVKVLGTTFNVKAYPEDSSVEASLFTGTIQLTTEKDPERVMLLRPREKVIINQKQDQSVTPAATKERRGERVSLQQIVFNRADSSFDETAWLKNKLVFKAVRFSEVANELQRKFNTDIRFNDPIFQDIRITATFSDESIFEIILALQQTIPFHYTSSGNKIYISQ